MCSILGGGGGGNLQIDTTIEFISFMPASVTIHERTIFLLNMYLAVHICIEIVHRVIVNIVTGLSRAV